MRAWEFFQRERGGMRGICVWHRRAGKDLFGINLIATKIFKRIGTYWHLLPTYRQGRNIIWNGFTRDGRAFLDFFPEPIVEKKLSNEMRIHFRNPFSPGKAGSIYQVVGTDEVNLLVGTNPVGCIFSEYALQDPAAWRYIAPILRENGGWALFITTPRGKNHAYEMSKMAKGNSEWFYDLQVAGDNGTKRPDGTPVIGDAEIEEERKAGMPEELIQQEYFCSFEAPLVGAFYGREMARALDEGRIRDIPYDPKIKVDTYWDLGMLDSTVILFAQAVRNEYRFIDYYESSGEALEHYKNVLEKRSLEQGYEYGHHYAPWDIEIRDLTSGRTRKEKARELGINFRIAPQLDVADGIENVRAMLPYCWFDSTRADRLIECIRSYRKEWDERAQHYRSTPVHDWASHAADAMRVFAWFNAGRNRWQKNNQKLPTRTIDDYAYI